MEIVDNKLSREVLPTLSRYTEFRKRQGLPTPGPQQVDTNYYGPGVLGIKAALERERRDAEHTSAEVIA